MELKQQQQALVNALEKAKKDTAFKNLLVADPIAAIEKLAGQKLNLPEGKTIEVRDQTDSSVIYLNIPQEMDVKDLELSDEQLEMVAGGNPILIGIIIGLLLD